MSAKLKEEIAISIEKINYLFKNILSKDSSSQKLELALLKKYAAELRDEIAAFEDSIFGETSEDLTEEKSEEKATVVTADVEVPTPLAPSVKVEVPDVEEATPSANGQDSEPVNPFIAKPNFLEKDDSEQDEGGELTASDLEQKEAPEPAGDGSKILAGIGIAGAAGLGLAGAGSDTSADDDAGLANKVDSILDKLGPQSPEEINMDTGIYDTSEFITENLPPLQKTKLEVEDVAELAPPPTPEVVPEVVAEQPPKVEFTPIDEIPQVQVEPEVVAQAEPPVEQQVMPVPVVPETVQPEPEAPQQIIEPVVESPVEVPPVAEPPVKETLAQRIMSERRQKDEVVQKAEELDDQATQLINQNVEQAPSLNVYQPSSPPATPEVKTQILTDLVEDQPSVEADQNMQQAGTLNDAFRGRTDGDLSQELASKASGGGFLIGFNQRHQFVNELFSGDEQVYERTLTELGNCKDYISALAYLNLNVKMKYRWNNEDPTAKEFNQIIRQRFI